MKKKEIEEYIKSKSISQDNYIKPTVQTSIDTKNAPALTQVALTVNPTKKSKGMIGDTIDKDLFIAKKTGSGLLRAGTNAVDAVLQETQNDLQKGAQRDLNYYGTTKPLLDVARVLAPHIVMPIENISKNIERQKQGMKLGDQILANLNDTKEMLSGTPTQALREAVRSYGTVDKALFGGKAPENIEKISETINKPSEKLQEQLAEEAKNYSGLINFAGNAGEQIGYMGPSIATTAITKNPNLGLAAMGISAKGGSTKEALQQGATLDQAINIGNAKAAVEVGTEKLTGGLNWFGKGALDNIATDLVDKSVKKPLLNFLAKQGIAIVGEQAEEVLADIADILINHGTVDPTVEEGGKTLGEKFKDYFKERLGETLSQTAATTVLLNLLGGAYSRNAYNQNKNQLQQIENNQSNINSQVAQNNSLEDTKIGNKTVLDTVKSLNEAERQALTEITIKRKNGISLDQNDIATINYLNNKDNDLSLSDAMTKAETDLEQGNVNYVNELMNNLDDVQIEGLENLDNNKIDLNQQLENQAENIMKNQEAMINYFNEYLDENGISNPTTQDIRNSFDDYNVYDENGGFDSEIENEYYNVIEEYLNNKNENNKYSEISEKSIDRFNKQIETSLENKNSQGTTRLGKISKNIINKVKSLLGIDVTNRVHTITNNDIRHMLKEHGNPNVEAKRGQIAITENDIKKIPDIIENPTDIEKGSDNKLGQTIRYIKKDNSNTTYVVEVVPDDSNSLIIKTMWKKPSTLDNSISTPISTPETKGSDISSTFADNISQNNKIVKESTVQENNIPAIKEGEPYIKITGEEGELYWKDQGADDKVAKILSEVPKEKTNLKNTANEVAGSLYRNIVSKGGEIEKIAFKTNKPNVNYTYDKMLRSMAEAQQHIGTAQADMNYNKYTNFTDANGNKVSMSLNDIRNDAKNSGISEQTLNEYLAHKLNEYRYEEGKPVFGKNITSEMSTETCNEIEKQHPEIKRIAGNVWQFEQNQLKNLYDSGLISEARYNELSKNKHYVRIQRQMSTNRWTKITTDKNGRVQVNQPIQVAKGGNQDIMPIMEGIAKYTTDLVKMERTNESMRELGKALGMGSTNENINAFTDEESFGVNPDLIKDNGDGTYSMTYFDKGVPTVVPINKGIYDAYVRNKAVSLIEGSKAFKTLSYAPRKISQVFRSLTTNNNPLFMATNFFKDIGDAPFNSKYTKEFAKTYLSTEALRQVARNGVYNQLYNAAGGNSDSYFVDGNFTDKTTSKVKKGIEKLWSPVQKGNEIVESVPRVAEFIATIKANGYEVNANGQLVAQKGVNPTKTANEVMNEALYNAAEITTNFKRGGDVAKSLNRNGATFLNASIQGFDKQIRNFKDALTSGDKKQIVNLLTKALIFGIAPTMLNDAANDDDDEYKEMPDYQKDNYYLFKTGDGKWIRIPKGRAMSVLGSAARRTKNFVKGDKNAYSGLVDFAKTQVAPNSIFENNILAPFSQVKNNKSWSGSKIIPDSIAKRPTEEQYNEKTDSFSKWLGQVFKDIPVPKEYENFKSPMAINYLIDQYTGAIGDVVLPMMAEKATSDQSPLIAPITSKFTVDSAYSNKSVSDFYDTKTEIEKKKNSVKATGMDTAKNSYMTSKNMQLSNLYKEQREIQSNSSLSKKEKYKQAREVQKEINNLAKETVEEVKNAKEEKYYIKIGDYYYKKVRQNGKDTYIRDTSKKIPTEKYALYDYFKEKYEKSKESD